jgi:hypothetical protein
MLPVKAYTYVFDLGKAEPKWEFHHELTEYYGMEDLSPSSFDKLSESFLTNDELALKFHNT